MKKKGLLLILIVLLLAGCGHSASKESAENEATEPVMDGGWEIRTDFSPLPADEEAALFSQAVEKLAGMEYRPACVLATKDGEKKEYSFLCTEAVRTKPEEVAWRILLVSQAEGEKAEVTGIMPVDLAHLHFEEEDTSVSSLSDWKVPEASASSLPEDAEEAFQSADKENEQALAPVVLLGTQVVASINYRILCIGEDAKEPSRNALYAVTIYQDLQWNASFTDVAKLDLTDYTKMVCQPLNPPAKT